MSQMLHVFAYSPKIYQAFLAIHVGKYTLRALGRIKRVFASHKKTTLHSTRRFTKSQGDFNPWPNLIT